MAKFPEIGGTARNDLFFAKLANDCLLQAQEHLLRAVKNREDAGGIYLDFLFADMKIEEASKTPINYAENTLEREPEAR